jgi:hypothetical protein
LSSEAGLVCQEAAVVVWPCAGAGSVSDTSTSSDPAVKPRRECIRFSGEERGFMSSLSIIPVPRNPQEADAVQFLSSTG